VSAMKLVNAKTRASRPNASGRTVSAAFAMTALATAVALVACADSGTSVGPLPDASGTSVPGEDAGDTGDAGVDSGPDGSGLPTCSVEGWCHTSLPSSVVLTGVWGDGLGVVWAIGSGGEILRWEHDAWKVHAKVEGPLLAIWGSGPTDIWVSSEGGLLHGQGASTAVLAFTPVAAPGDPLAPIVSIWGSGPTDVWAVGGRIDVTPHEGRVLHYAGVGEGWTLENVTAEPIAFSHVWGTSASGVWMSGVFYSDVEFAAEGAVLRRAVGAVDFTGVVLPEDPLVGVRGRLGVTGGVGATAITTSLVGRTIDGLPAVWRASSVDDGKTFTWSFERGVAQDPSLKAVWEIASNDTWAAGDYGRLRHWDGKEWTQSFVSISGPPMTKAFSARWASPAKDLWVVGDRVAVHRDLSR
jgi:hypothetical protein